MPLAEMSLLFATSFSRSCVEAAPAVSRWMADVSSTLTVLHVHDPSGEVRRSDAERKLREFYSDADRSPLTKRVLLQGRDPAQVIAEFLARHKHDMVVCPVGTEDVPSPSGSHSTRAKLLASTDITLWTGSVSEQRRAQKPQRVGCMLARASASGRPLTMAREYALRVGATLQLLYMVPSAGDERLHHAPTQHGLAHRIAPQGQVPADPPGSEVHAVVGMDTHQILSLLERAQTEILFVGKQDALRRTAGTHQMQRFVDRAGCPVVCVDDDRALPGWRLRTIPPSC